MKIKTSELIKKTLNWAVTKCELQHLDDNDPVVQQHAEGLYSLNYSEDWGLFGPINDREEISINRDNAPDYIWAAWTHAPIRDESEAYGYGNTQLIAACRCYVSSILGDEVDIPDCLSTPPMPRVAAPNKQVTTDLTYRVVDNMFTAFFANTPAGEQVWKVIAAQNEGTGKVLTAHIESTIRQIREAGYSVAKEATTDDDDDELLAALAV